MDVRHGAVWTWAGAPSAPSASGAPPPEPSRPASARLTEAERNAANPYRPEYPVEHILYDEFTTGEREGACGS
jgi:hypothetical protein